MIERSTVVIPAGASVATTLDEGRVEFRLTEAVHVIVYGPLGKRPASASVETPVGLMGVRAEGATAEHALEALHHTLAVHAVLAKRAYERALAVFEGSVGVLVPA